MRMVKHIEQSPKEVKTDDGVWICMCGLSKNKPFCDGSHHKTKDEENEKLYMYDENGNRKEIREVI